MSKFMSNLKLLFKKSRERTEEEKAIVKTSANWITWFMVLASAGVLGFAYYATLRDYPPGPLRDMVLQVINAMSICLVSGFIGYRILAWSARLRPSRAIPVAILATIIAVVGNSTLFDVALRLKSEAARAEVRGPAIVKFGKIMRPKERPADTDSLIVESADYVRALKDPAKIREMHAEADKLIEKYRK